MPRAAGRQDLSRRFSLRYGEKRRRGSDYAQGKQRKAGNRWQIALVTDGAGPLPSSGGIPADVRARIAPRRGSASGAAPRAGRVGCVRVIARRGARSLIARKVLVGLSHPPFEGDPEHPDAHGDHDQDKEEHDPVLDDGRADGGSMQSPGGSKSPQGGWQKSVQCLGFSSGTKTGSREPAGPSIADSQGPRCSSVHGAATPVFDAFPGKPPESALLKNVGELGRQKPVGLRRRDETRVRCKLREKFLAVGRSR
jgi:hypothetical protein